ncbi:hypothetical protein QYF61_026764 [Mycteria americana]|uniref:Uncharacterized protein n=1 Tax=Mycteria americana TaxID=33587 RepID=A0AAN7NJ89_MYCAM|nr:hypothetical protein QYF61_026764 [Mycteria americana]
MHWGNSLYRSSPSIQHLLATTLSQSLDISLFQSNGTECLFFCGKICVEIFPNTQSKPPLTQREAISSHPMACYLGEETDSHLATTSFQAVVESDKVSPQPPFLQAKQSQLPQPLLIRLLLQTLHQLRCPSLDSLQHLNVSLVVGGPKLNTVFEVRPHQCRVQGHDHFPSPAGHTTPDTSQDAVGFLGHQLAHVQPAVNQHPQVSSLQAARCPGEEELTPLESKRLKNKGRSPCEGAYRNMERSKGRQS